MTARSTRASTLPRALGGAATAVWVWLAGMLVQFHATLLSGLARVPGEWNDARFSNFVLEHGYRWLLRVPTDARFWDAPAFFPAPNVAAYSEVLLSVAPPYWLLRAAGVSPDTAFELWLLVMSTLNYVAAYLLLRRALRVGVVAASAGAFVFAFGASRGAQVVHPQLVPQFFALAALHALWRLLGPADDGGAANAGGERRWIATFFLAVVAQLYGGFYHAWFLGFALLLAASWALAARDTRATLLGVARRRAGAIAACAGAGALLALPLAAHYLRAARDVGLHDFWTVEPMLPRPASWVHVGSASWLYGRLAGLDVFRALPMEREQRLGLGVVTPIVALWGLWGARRHAFARLMLLTSATVVAVTTVWAPGMSLWPVAFGLVPGAAAVRAVARIGMLLLVPASFGVALAAERVRRVAARRPELALLALPVALVVAAEPVQNAESYDRAAARARASAVSRAIPAGCAAFLYTPLDARGDMWWYHGDAMWAALERSVPTANGYSGNVPRDWPLFDVGASTPAQDSVLAARLSAWERRWRLAPNTICRVRLATPEAR